MRSILTALLALTGCMEAVPVVERERDKPLQTSETAFVMIDDGEKLEVDIPVEYSNDSGGTVYFKTCHHFVPHVLERTDESKWKPFWAPVLFDCLDVDPIAVSNEATRRDTVRIRDYYRVDNAYPTAEWREKLPGIFRLRMDEAYSTFDSTTIDFDAELPVELRLSNAFSLSID